MAQSVLDMIPLYLSEGEAEGVRGDIAFAQSCLETGNFSFSQSAVTLDQNNFAGMGVVQNGMKGLAFDSPQLGIRCQIQHLKAYACTDALENENVDPRFRFVIRGSAPYVEWLGIRENPQGKGWAAGPGYGAKILSILKDIIGAAGNGGSVSGSVQPPYLVKVSIPDLNIRKGPGTNNEKTGKYTGMGIFTVVEESDGIGAGKWGLLKAYQKERNGWIALDYTTRI